MHRRPILLVTIIVIAIAIVVTLSYAYAQYNIGNIPNAIEDKSRWFYGFRLSREILRHYIVEVSDEYRTRIENILRSDPNASTLLENGYSITVIKPIVRFVVQGDGSIVMRADKAVVILAKNGENRTIVYIDVINGFVIEIVKCERILKNRMSISDRFSSMWIEALDDDSVIR
ncbi:MAG: hypothetical protein QXK54_05450 [Ignisphaera sp.]